MGRRENDVTHQRNFVLRIREGERKCSCDLNKESSVRVLYVLYNIFSCLMHFLGMQIHNIKCRFVASAYRWYRCRYTIHVCHLVATGCWWREIILELNFIFDVKLMFLMRIQRSRNDGGNQLWNWFHIEHIIQL